MYNKPLNYEKHIMRRGLPLVVSGDKTRPDSIFSPEVFGIVDKERYEKTAAIPLNTFIMSGWALDEFKRLDRTIFECATTKGKFTLLPTGELKKVDKDYVKQSPEELIGYGPYYLYTIWDKIDKRKFNKQDGKVANILMARSVLNYTRDQLFKQYQYVPAIAFREEQQDSIMIFNEINAILSEIAKFANLIKANNSMMDTNDLKVYLQNKVFELYEYGTKLYGSKGQIRKKILSRVVDNSASAVILPATYQSSVLGNSRFTTDSMGFPIYHLNKMYIYVVKRYFTVLIEMLYDHGYFDPELTKDRLIVYDQDFIDNGISQFEDNFFKVQPFPAIKQDGTFGEIMMDFEVDGKSEKKVLTWMEFFYIVLYVLADVENKRYTATTRYPIDSDKSCQIVRPIVLTLMDRYLKKVSFMVFEDIEYFPYVTEEVASQYHEKIFETGIRLASTVAVAYNGDHDGDKVSSKPINSLEAVEEAREYHDNLLSLFNYTGDFSMKVGKCAAQTLYTFTREPKPKDESKAVNKDHELVKYLMSIEDGKLDLNVLYKWTTIYANLEKPIISIYDTTTITRNGKKIDTTIGQLIVNKVIFARLWDNPHFEYVHYMTEKSFVKKMKHLRQLSIEEKVTVADLKKTVDLYSEFVLRLATIYNAGCTSEMLNTDEDFKNYRDKCFDEVREEIIKNNDIELLEKTIKKVIEYAKEKYKDNDMYELYESEGKSSWTGDFATMQISVGGVASLTGDKPALILNSLNDGIPYENMAEFANTGMRGAVDRGNETALAGEQYKNISNAAASVLGFRGDCGTKEGEQVNITNPDLLFNRYVIESTGNLVKVTTENIDKYLGKDIVIRTPFKCKTKNGHFCSTCSGDGPFDLAKTDTVNLGLFITDIASKILNLFMQSTHELVVHVFNIKNFNDYIYPKPEKPMFYHEVDPVDGIEKIRCNYDVEWRIPKSAVTPIDTVYSVLAHGSVLSCIGSEVADTQEHSIILGTEVTTNPFEIVKPASGDNDDTKHFIFRYKKGDVIINSTQSYMKTKTVYRMIQLYLRGSVSNLIPLEAHLMTLKNTFKTNKSLGDNDLSLTLLLATLARDNKDIFKTARETGTDDYIFIATDDLVSISNTFNIMIGPDAGRGMFITMARSYEEQTANPSPIEKAFQS